MKKLFKAAIAKILSNSKENDDRELIEMLKREWKSDWEYAYWNFYKK